MKKYYLIYQIRNKLNGMIYVGKHQTEDLNDGYMGSGIRIVRAIEKYGVENLEKTILFECSSVEEMNAKEAEIVNEEFIARDDVYNIKLGGEGGWQWLNNGDYCAGSEKRKNARKKAKQLYVDHPELHDQFCKSISEGIRNKIAKMSDNEREEFRQKNSKRAKCGFSKAFLGRHHKPETIEKIKHARKENPLIGDKNGMRTHMWIRNPHTKETKAWPRNQEIPFGWERGTYINETEKVLEARKKFAKNNKGKCKIFNPITGEIKYIDKSDVLPAGFERRGKPMSSEAKQHLHEYYEKQSIEVIAPKRIEELRPQYAYYLQNGWKKFKEHYNYPYSHANFVQACKRYLSEYKSNQGRKL